MPVLDPQALIDNRVQAIRAYHDSIRFHRAQLDLSGGIDSATMLLLLVRALGPDNIVTVFSGIHSSADSHARAVEAAHAAGMPLVDLDLSDVFELLQTRMRDGISAAGYDREWVDEHIGQNPIVLGSLRSCLRAPVGRGINRMLGGGIRHGTGNECEDRFLRFYQKGGDGEVDSNPIAMLSKGEVFQLARALGVPRSILEAVPSPDLQGVGEAHNDEDELRDTYGVAWTYSRVDPDSGAYTRVGSIERMARLLDEDGVEAQVFGATEPDAQAWSALQDRALQRCFAGFAPAEVLDLLHSARHIERITRHKHNPNCPSLGTREELLAARILDDSVPC